MEFEKVYGIKYAMAYQLASDISYINELNVKVDFIKTIPENVREMFSYITGKPYRLEEYEKFTYEMMDWYSEQNSLRIRRDLCFPMTLHRCLLDIGTIQ